jgi:tetratricopeptide (TPR) repeat protein
MLVDSNAMTAPGGLSKALVSPYLAPIEDISAPPPYYRPASLITLMIERRLFGTDPLGYRIAHAGLHIANAALIFLIALWFLVDRGAARGDAGRGALFSGLVFITMPYNVDSVCFLSDIGSLMSLHFTMLAAIFFRRYLRSGSAAAVAPVLLSLALGLASKETSLAIPIVLSLQYLLVDRLPSHGRAGAAILSSVAVCAVYMAIRFSVLDHPIGMDVPSAATRFAGDMAVAIRHALLPHPISVEVPLADAPAIPLVLLGMAALLAISGLVFFWRRRQPLLAFCAGAWLVSLAPSMLALDSLLVFPARYLYFPSAWLALAAGLTAARRGRLLSLGAAALVLSLGLLAAIRVGRWDDSLSLWGEEAARHPDRPYPLVQLAGAMEEVRGADAARPLYYRAVSLPFTARERASVALAHVKIGEDLSGKRADPDSAVEHFRRAAQINPRSPGAWLGIGNIHARDGDWQKALAAFRHVRTFLPDHLEATTAEAGALAALGRFDEALATLDRAARIASGAPERLGDIAKKRAAIGKLRSDRRNSARGPSTK